MLQVGEPSQVGVNWDNRPPWPLPLIIFLLWSPLKRVSYFLSETKCTALFYYGNSAILESITSIKYQSLFKASKVEWGWGPVETLLGLTLPKLCIKNKVSRMTAHTVLFSSFLLIPHQFAFYRNQDSSSLSATVLLCCTDIYAHSFISNFHLQIFLKKKNSCVAQRSVQSI